MAEDWQEKIADMSLQEMKDRLKTLDEKDVSEGLTDDEGEEYDELEDRVAALEPNSAEDEAEDEDDAEEVV